MKEQMVCEFCHLVHGTGPGEWSPPPVDGISGAENNADPDSAKEGK